jgi:hypothetical protein
MMIIKIRWWILLVEKWNWRSAQTDLLIKEILKDPCHANFLIFEASLKILIIIDLKILDGVHSSGVDYYGLLNSNKLTNCFTNNSKTEHISNQIGTKFSDTSQSHKTEWIFLYIIYEHIRIIWEKKYLEIAWETLCIDILTVFVFKNTHQIKKFQKKNLFSS